MEVIIDGVKYIPETDKTIEINGRSYGSVGNWLNNIHYSLLSEWVSYVKRGEAESQKAKSLNDKIMKFKEYTNEFLGFRYDEDTLKLIEIDK